MATDTTYGMVELWDDFTKDISDYVETVTGSATGVDIRNLHGGWIRLDVDGDDADAVTIGAEVVWEADEGSPIIAEARVRSTDVSVSCLFFGMSDANNDTVVIEDEDGTMNSVATDAFGFLLEGEQDETWSAVGVQSDTDNNSGAPVALTSASDAADDTTQTLKLEADPADSGTVRYYVDGELVSTQTSWFRSSILYCPIINIDDRNTTYQADMDYWLVRAPRS